MLQNIHYFISNYMKLAAIFFPLLCFFSSIFAQTDCDTTASGNRNYPYLVECKENNKLVSQTLYSASFQKGSETYYTNDSIFRTVFFKDNSWRMHYVEKGAKKRKIGLVFHYDSLQNIIASGKLFGTWIDTLELYTFYPTGEKQEHFFQEGINGCKINDYELFYQNGKLSLKGQYDDCIKTGIWFSYDKGGILRSQKRFLDNKPEGGWYYIQDED